MQKSFLSLGLAVLAVGMPGVFVAQTLVAHADSIGPTTFEPPTFSLGSIDGQNGWGGDSTPINPAYDQGVVTTTVSGFGTQALRISDAVTSGSFGDWIFAAPLANAAGEPSSTAAGFSVGTLQSHFEVQFDFASTQATEQPGLHVSISPDRGDGSRMSYLRLEDATSGINVFFDDVQGTSSPANFVETEVASGLDRTVKHTAKLVMDFVPGPSNDVVQVYIDGVLVHTGTSWENYYRYDAEAAAEQSPRVIKTIIMQARGTATPADLGKGFLFDNISLLSSTPTPLSAPTLLSPPNGSTTTTAGLTSVSWNSVTDPAGGITYVYQASNTSTTNPNGSFTSPVYTSGALSSTTLPTPGTPAGIYFWHVQATDADSNISPWSTMWMFTVNNTVTPPPPTVATTKDQCMSNGWQTLVDTSGHSFKNQGDCVSFVATKGKNTAAGH